MSSRLQLDMHNLNLGRRHLVNAYEVKASIGVIAGNTVWSMPERLECEVLQKAHFINTLTCTFTFITTLLDFCWILLVLNTVGSMYEVWIECLAGRLNCRSGADSEAGYRNVNGGNLCLYNCLPVILNIIHVNRFTSLVQWPSETWTTIDVMCM